jgi:RNA polymerase sigma factor (sigma-70 family)
MDAEPSLAAVFDASYQQLVAQLFAVSGSQQEAEDAVQEAFVKALGLGRRWAGVDNPEAWLRTAALNHLRNRWRHLSVVRRLSAQVPGPRQVVELGPDHVALVEALRKLKPDLRQAVALHYVADLPVAAIAAELDIPVGTVKWRLSRARELLGAELNDLEESDHV